MDPKPTLDQLAHLEATIADHASAFSYNSAQTFSGDNLYCPPCGDLRRMNITPIFTPPTHIGSEVAARRLNAPMMSHGGLNRAAPIAPQLVPSLFIFSCVQCDARFTAMIYLGPDGPALAVLPSRRGGLTTPHTPAGVAFYLDQAHRAQAVGANSAAIAMFRGALEHLLFEQGYKTGMLNAKLTKLEADLKGGSAPTWAKDIDTEFLAVLKDLGNGAIHPNDGNVDNQAVLDTTLLARVTKTFVLLLFLVYEIPHKKGEALGELRAKAGILIGIKR